MIYIHFYKSFYVQKYYTYYNTERSFTFEVHFYFIALPIHLNRWEIFVSYELLKYWTLEQELSFVTGFGDFNVEGFAIRNDENLIPFLNFFHIDPFFPVEEGSFHA